MPWARALFPTTFCIQHKLYSADRVPLHELIDIVLDYSLLRFQSGIQP